MAWNIFTGCHTATLAWLAPRTIACPAHLSLASRVITLACLLGALALPASAAEAPVSDLPELTDTQLAWLGDRIFANECNRQTRCLTAWNAGEDFPSLGIGHFIWYRQNQDGMFEESFPALIAFMQARGLAVPDWIMANDVDAPWPDRDAFLADLDGPRLAALRALLAETMPAQTAFIVSRFDAALAAMLASTEVTAEKERLVAGFTRVAASKPPHGLYALIDYVNFKGTGVSPRETYNNQGWGLKQVLLGMNGETNDALADFVASAQRVLATRVDNAPIERNESRWLAGWNNRLATYLPMNTTDH